MVKGRLRQGRVGHLPQVAQRQIGIALAQVAKDRQGIRKRIAKAALLEELRRRTRETEIWAQMERERRAPKLDLEIRVEPPAE